MQRTLALAAAIILVLAGCVRTADDGTTTAGAARDVIDAAAPLYSPVDRSALALGLPDLVQGVRLLPSDAADLEAEEALHATDLIVRPVLVAHGLGGSAITIEQKTSRPRDPAADGFETVSLASGSPGGDPAARERAMPDLAVAAVQVRTIPADEFMGFDSSFYMLLTALSPDDYLWAGEKPAPTQATLGGREVWHTDWGRFRTAWYAYGEVLYVVLASNQQLLEAALRQMPPLPTMPG